MRNKSTVKQHQSWYHF